MSLLSFLFLIYATVIIRLSASKITPKLSVNADNGLKERGAHFGDVLDFDLGFDLCDVT